MGAQCQHIRDKDHTSLLSWLFADSRHSRQKLCRPWGCPGCLKKQMGGLTSPTLFHLLQDWSSNWAHVMTKRKATTSRPYRKHTEHIEFLHRNKNSVHNSWKISQCFYFSKHILAFHKASPAELVALMPHQTFSIGFPPPENLIPRSLSWSLQSRQSELCNKTIFREVELFSLQLCWNYWCLKWNNHSQ